FLEKLGIYNPNTNPATIEINVDHSVKWLQNGAQPSETAKRILSYKGVLLKHHLLTGVRKGALTVEQVDEKFNAWLEEKEKTINNKVAGLDKVEAEAKAKALKAEKEVNDKRAAAAAEAVVEEEAPKEEEAPQTDVVEETVEDEVVAAPVETEVPSVEEKAPETDPTDESKEDVAPAAPEKAEADPASDETEEAPAKEK